MKVGSEDEAAVIVRAARADKRKLEIIAGGTRRACGRPMDGCEILDVSGLSGIRSYEPEELILTAAPGTSVAEINAALDAKGQRLGFDPANWSSLLGATGTSTLGGSLSADASGSGALRFGRARDSLLGLRAVNGFGEPFKAGGKVVKNVTGFDIPKLVCGAFGTLCVLTEVTFRVFPKAPRAATLVLRDAAPEQALALLRRAWASALEPTGLAYIPGGMTFAALGDIGRGAALFRVEGAPAPLGEKLSALRDMLAGHDLAEIEGGDSLFTMIGSGAGFVDSQENIWRVAVPPSRAAEVSAKINAPLWLADWAGGLLWIASSDIDLVRAASAEAGGHAMLLRADAQTRAAAGLFAPQTEAHAALTKAVKAAFDPLGLFNPGRLFNPGEM